MELYSSEKFKPEELALIGRAIGTVVHGTLIVGRDGRSISRYGKRAMTVGILSAGTTAMDVRLIPLVVLKDFAHMKGLPLAYVYYNDGVRVEISGMDLDEVKAILDTKNFVEAQPNDIGATVYYPNALDDFLHDLFRYYKFTVDGKVLVDCMNTPAVLLFPRLSEHFGFEADVINDMMTSYVPPKPKEVFLQRLKKGDYRFGLRFKPEGIIEFYGSEKKVFTSTWKLFDYLKSIFG
ncbi:phosphohexomutase domain-containing protein [Palaeococcus ferrophilus]|uniref:phospho-sugar mutase n=1 Tax=Palaeococcus ferrophilus TaxID=83868 RepID=UPI00064F25A9|nr:phospho-sugar mutase [Palaeococcus ferrophilus]